MSVDECADGHTLSVMGTDISWTDFGGVVKLYYEPIEDYLPVASIEDTKTPDYAKLRDSKRPKGSKGRHRNRYGRAK